MILSSPLALSRHIFHYYYFIQLQHSLLELGSLLCTADTCFKTWKLALETFQNTAMLTTLLCLVTHFSRRADTRGLCLCHIRSPQTFIVNSTLDFVQLRIFFHLNSNSQYFLFIAMTRLRSARHGRHKTTIQRHRPQHILGKQSLTNFNLKIVKKKPSSSKRFE